MAYKYLNDDGLKAYTKKVKGYISSLLPTKSITYSELKALRDAGGLLSGRKYRITDFVTTSVQAETRSAGHAFDIIVVADDASTLNENARAIPHKGDTYFKDCKLNAWELKYCLDNDTTRFAWADATNGKGVVWWMKDEWDNECYYDFKNIQYKLYAGTGQAWDDYVQRYLEISDPIIPYRLTRAMVNRGTLGTFEIDDSDFIWAYTWSAYETTKQTFDKSLKADGTKDTYEDIVHNCKVGANWETIQKDDESVYSRLSLNFYITIPFFVDSKDESFRTYSIKIGSNCHDIVTGRSCYTWTCGNDCSHWTCGNEVSNSKILQDYVSYFHLDSGVSYVTIKSSGTPTRGTPLKNFKVKAGIKGAFNNKLAIVIDASSFPLNSDYEWTIAKNSSGAIKQYCEADLIN